MEIKNFRGFMKCTVVYLFCMYDSSLYSELYLGFQILQSLFEILQLYWLGAKVQQIRHREFIAKTFFESGYYGNIFHTYLFALEEELMYRYMLPNMFIKVFLYYHNNENEWKAHALSNLLFSLEHIPRNLHSFLFPFCFGLLLSYSYLHFQSYPLIICSLIHFLWNGILFLGFYYACKFYIELGVTLKALKKIVGHIAPMPSSLISLYQTKKPKLIRKFYQEIGFTPKLGSFYIRDYYPIVYIDAVGEYVYCKEKKEIPLVYQRTLNFPLSIEFYK